MKTHTHELVVTGLFSLLLAATCSLTFYTMGWNDRAAQDVWLHPKVEAVPITATSRTPAVPIPTESIPAKKTEELLPLPTEKELLGTDLLLPEIIPTSKQVRKTTKRKV